MNPQTIKLIATLFSMKDEIRLIFLTLGVICLLPVLTVLIITQAGINIVSGSLISFNPQTSQVDIHDPATHEVVDHVDQTTMWPVSGPVSLEFGQSDIPYQILHTGIDIASPVHQVGDPIRSFMKGTVTYAGQTSYGYGKHVKIDNGHFVTSVYGHLDAIGVSEGDTVDAGSIIGLRGTTGWSTGPHLHFEIRVFGIPVDPRVFLAGDP